MRFILVFLVFIFGNAFAQEKVNGLVLANAPIASQWDHFSSVKHNDDVDSTLLFKNGLFIDGLFAVNYFSSYSYNEVSFGPGVRVGHKWYFGRKQNTKFGIQVDWMRAIWMIEAFGDPYVAISPLNFGIMKTWKRSKGKSIELNLKTAFTYYAYFDFALDGVPCWLINPEIKYQKGKFVVGLSYNWYREILDDNPFVINSATLSLGVKL